MLSSLYFQKEKKKEKKKHKHYSFIAKQLLLSALQHYITSAYLLVFTTWHKVMLFFSFLPQKILMWIQLEQNPIITKKMQLLCSTRPEQAILHTRIKDVYSAASKSYNI